MKITRKELERNLDFYKNEILSGKIFIYPTDTIYGIGCIANNLNSVSKIKEIKKRDKNKPLSIIVPSFEWIYNNCHVFENHEDYLKKLPGPYTFILNMKNDNSISSNINKSTNSVGVRIPNNWFAQFISNANVPFVTTSVNLSGEPFLTDIKDLNKSIENQVDYIIDDGILNGRPSTIIDLTQEEEKVIRK